MDTSSITIDELLQTTSRTFALSIPLLPEPLAHKVTLSYLVFRIADTMEDAEYLDRDQRQAALSSFCQLLEDPTPEAAQAWSSSWTSRHVSENQHYNRLLQEVPQVLATLSELESPDQERIIFHATRSAYGMEEFLDQADEDANLTLANLHDLKRYCYFVAGIVGELITELFVADHPELSSAALLENAAAFGEGLQLVNILKDSSADARCGRAYLPPDVPTAAVHELAREDLKKAETYVETLRIGNAPAGYIAFCDTPIQLAKATLSVVESHGPGSKVPREQTMNLIQGVLQRAGLEWEDFLLSAMTRPTSSNAQSSNPQSSHPQSSDPGISPRESLK